MRVIHVAPTAFGSDGLYGGGERYPLELAKEVARLVDCRLITFGPRSESRTEGALRIETLKTSVRLKAHPAHPLGAGLARRLQTTDVIHTHHMRSAPSRLAALVGRSRKTLMAVTDHGLGGGGWGGLLPRMFDLFLPVSRYSADTLHAPQAKTRIIYGGADTARFSPQRAAPRSGVLFIGRITPHKGIDNLIRALPDGAHLVVAGTPGHDRGAKERRYAGLLTRLAEGRDVTFAGAVPEDRLPELYRTAQVVALPSVHHTCYGKFVAIPELLGLSLLEAMAAGTPVVCSAVGGLPEVVVHGETGYLVEPGNVEELHDRLAALMGNPRLAQTMGAAARAHVESRFTWRRCAERCVAGYEDVSSGAA